MKGKWEAVECNGLWCVREIEADGNPIVVARNVRDEATARTIAAVPELLKVLEESNEWVYIKTPPDGLYGGYENLSNYLWRTKRQQREVNNETK